MWQGQSLLFAALALVLRFTADGFVVRSLPFRASSLYSSQSKVVSVSDSSSSALREGRVAAVKGVLSGIVDPDEGSDVVSSGVVSVDVLESGLVSLRVSSSTLSATVLEQIRESCKRELESAKLGWVARVEIDAAAPADAAGSAGKVMAAETPARPAGMAKIKNIIAVSSCKGGVGKSTVSVNLAYTLKMAGARVGILDADIYGPSLPTMTKPASTEVVFSNDQLQPLEYEGVKLMSMGFINKGAAIMRGPMVNQILNQFVSLCNWGELDYLILDMPPGTGDIQLTLAQIMDISAAIIVTTPQRLSFVDVVKGIDMFDTVNIPCVAVVENMAAFAAYSFSDDFFDQLAQRVAGTAAVSIALSKDLTEDSASIRALLVEAVEAQKVPRRIFGEGHTQRLRDMWGIENIVSLPLLDEVSRSGDAGAPYVLTYPDSEVAEGIAELAAGVMAEIKVIAEAKKSSAGVEDLVYSSGDNVLLFGAARIPPKALRVDCKCASCVEEMTGRKLLNPDSVPDSVKPLSMGKIGRYAISVDWSDGHKSLFPFRQIAKLL